MGSSKSGGGGGDPRYSAPTTAEGADYLSRYGDVAGSGMNPYYHYVDYGQAEGRTWGIQQQEPAFDMESIFAGMFESQQSQSEAYAQQQADYEAKQEQIMKDAERSQAMASIDSLFGSKLDAADRAASEINSEIAKEQDSALMRGLDYSLSEEDRSARVNNRFAEYWGEGDEMSLGNLLGEWKPSGYEWDSGVVRGTPSTKKDEKKEPKKVGGRIKSGQSGSTSATEDELGGGTALGV